MSTYDNSYSLPSDVAALVPRYTDTTTRVFDTNTRPTLSQVESYIDRISAVLNLYLAKNGFSIPVTQNDAQMACAQIVIESVVDLCHAANSAGRFYTDRELRGQSPLRILRNELSEWVDENAAGFEEIGVTRATSNVGQIGYRGTDETSDDIHPIFQRKGYGNRLINWDA